MIRNGSFIQSPTMTSNASEGENVDLTDNALQASWRAMGLKNALMVICSNFTLIYVLHNTSLMQVNAKWIVQTSITERSLMKIPIFDATVTYVRPGLPSGMLTLYTSCVNTKLWPAPSPLSCPVDTSTATIIQTAAWNNHIHVWVLPFRSILSVKCYHVIITWKMSLVMNKWILFVYTHFFQ